MRTRLTAAVLSALMLLGGGLVQTAAASQRNGELCAVQSWDETIVVSVLTTQFKDARLATPQQVAHAGAWCSNQVAVRGWMPASKFYDKYTDQADVCVASTLGSDIEVWVHASPEAYADAYNACLDMQGGNPNTSLVWWP